MVFFITSFPKQAFKNSLYFLQSKFPSPPLFLFKKITFPRAFSVFYCYNLVQGLIPREVQEVQEN